MVLDQYSSYYSSSERIYDESRVTVSLAHGKAVCGLQFTSDGMYLVSTGNDNTVRLWDVIGGVNMMVNYGSFVKNSMKSRVPMTLTHSQQGACEPSLLFHPANDSSICVFDLFNGRLVKRLIGHFKRVYAMAIRHTDTDIKLFSAADDGDILLWEELDIVEESEPEDLWEDDLYED
jgi:DNA excision repair protein ERCC-8